MQGHKHLANDRLSLGCISALAGPAKRRILRDGAGATALRQAGARPRLRFLLGGGYCMTAFAWFFSPTLI